MDQLTPVENKKSFLQNDRKLVCGMLIFYGLCILGLIVITFWGLDGRNKRFSANATSSGGLTLLVEINEERPVSIWFDNFGLQPR